MLAYNNPKKEDSRVLIANVIKEHLPNQKIKMFELVGGGVGARYYAANLPMEHMALVEKKTELYEAFDVEKLGCEANLYRCDAYKFFETIFVVEPEYRRDFFNVINLDFCAWYYDNDKPNSTSQIINKMFESKALCSNGLLFCTFQVDGFNLDLYKQRTGDDVPLTANEILMQITYLAMKNGYRIKGNKVIFENKYHSGSRRGQQMLNIAFQVVRG